MCAKTTSKSPRHDGEQRQDYTQVRSLTSLSSINFLETAKETTTRSRLWVWTAWVSVVGSDVAVQGLCKHSAAAGSFTPSFVGSRFLPPSARSHPHPQRIFLEEKNDSSFPQTQPTRGPSSFVGTCPSTARGTPSHLNKSLETTLAFSRGDLCMTPGSLPGRPGLELLVPHAPLASVPGAGPFFSDPP